MSDHPHSTVTTNTKALGYAVTVARLAIDRPSRPLIGGDAR